MQLGRPRGGLGARLAVTVERALTSAPEREEARLEERLARPRAIDRPHTVVVASPKGGVGKTTCTFALGCLLAERTTLRVLAIDLDPDHGTLPLLLGDDRRAATGANDLMRDADAVESAARLRSYMSVDRTGLHVLAGPVAADDLPVLLALCQRYHDIVLADLGTGLAAPIARRALERASAAVVVSTPEWATSTSVGQALADGLPGLPDGRPVTVTLNRVDRDRGVARARDALAAAGAGTIVELPEDARLAAMLDSGTYGFAALDRPGRVGLRRLALAVLDGMIDA